MSSIIIRWVSKYEGTELFAAFQKNLKISQNWACGRNIDPKSLEVGNKIDVRDTEFIWCKAEVREIIKEKD